MKILDRSSLRQLVPMETAIELMKRAFAELSAGRARSPVRLAMEISDDPSVLLLMPAHVPAEHALAFKTVAYFGRNAERGLPTIHAVVCVFDDATGQPMGLMDGAYVTALRTGAVSGAATDLLARPDCRTAVIIGAGVQGVTQAAAVCAVRPIERVIAVDVSEAQLDRYRQALARDWPACAEMLETTTDASAAVRQADVICTATTARTPVFDPADVRPGTHINAVGAFTPEMREIPAETVRDAIRVVDQHEAIMAEAGDLLAAIEAGYITPDDLRLELGHLVEQPELGRQGPEDITLFKSVGNAVQDAVVGRYAVDRATELGVGVEISLDS